MLILNIASDFSSNDSLHSNFPSNGGHGKRKKLSSSSVSLDNEYEQIINSHVLDAGNNSAKENAFIKKHYLKASGFLAIKTKGIKNPGQGLEIYKKFKQKLQRMNDVFNA
jgi:hypothetical protein